MNNTLLNNSVTNINNNPNTLNDNDTDNNNNNNNNNNNVEYIYRKKISITRYSYLCNIFMCILSTITTVTTILLYKETHDFFNKGSNLINKGILTIDTLNMTNIYNGISELFQLENCILYELNNLGMCKSNLYL